MKTFESCRRAFPVFLYRNYTVFDTGSELRITFHFEIPGLSSFDPVWHFPKKDAAPVGIEEDPCLRNMIFGLGMVELISYWKIACPPQVRVTAGALTEAQIRWWKDLYYLGLGEFFYTNRIETDPESFMELTGGAPEADTQVPPPAALNGCLIQIGRAHV